MALPVLFDQILSEETLCSFILEVCDTEKWESIDVNRWVFDKVNEKNQSLDNNFINNLYKQMENDGIKETVKVVMFSDLHIDYDYEAGASIDCGNIICCRTDSGPAKSLEDMAGYWGDYKCDPPP